MKKLSIILIAIVTLLSFSSCDNRRPIYPESGAWVIVNLDWKNLEEDPNGATVRFFPQTRPELPIVTLRTNNTVDSAFLKRDNYSVVVMNETVDSHSNMEFVGADSYESFAAQLKSVLNPSVGGDEIVTSGEPDILASDSLGHLEITRKSVIEEKRYHVSFTPEMCTKNLRVTLYINGIDNLRAAAQSLTVDGMIKDLTLYNGESTGTTTSHNVVFTEKVLDEGTYHSGYLRGDVNCFGIVGGDVRNTVDIYFALRDGNMHYVKGIDVTGRIYTEEDDENQLYLDLYDITLPEVEDIYNTGSGFDAEVGDWDEVEDVVVPVI